MPEPKSSRFSTYWWALVVALIDIAGVALAILWPKAVPPALLIPAVTLVTLLGMTFVFHKLSGGSDVNNGEFRRAITITVIVLYAFVMAVSLFASSSPLTDLMEANTSEQPEISAPAAATPAPAADDQAASDQEADSNEAASTESEGSEAGSPVTVEKIVSDLYGGLTGLVELVIGFYFASRVVDTTTEKITETVKAVKGASKGNKGKK